MLSMNFAIINWWYPPVIRHGNWKSTRFSGVSIGIEYHLLKWCTFRPDMFDHRRVLIWTSQLLRWLDVNNFGYIRGDHWFCLETGRVDILQNYLASHFKMEQKDGTRPARRVVSKCSGCLRALRLYMLSTQVPIRSPKKKWRDFLAFGVIKHGKWKSTIGFWGEHLLFMN